MHTHSKIDRHTHQGDQRFVGTKGVAIARRVWRLPLRVCILLPEKISDLRILWRYGVPADCPPLSVPKTMEDGTRPSSAIPVCRVLPGSRNGRGRTTPCVSTSAQFFPFALRTRKFERAAVPAESKGHSARAMHTRASGKLRGRPFC